MSFAYEENLQARDEDLVSTPQYAGWTAANVSTTTVVAYAFTGDYRIDTLIENLSERWNAGSPLGTPVTVTYSFMAAAPFYGGTDDGTGDTGFLPFTSTQKVAARQILNKLASELNVRFVETTDSMFSYGDIRFGMNYQASSSGYSWLPNSAGEQSGDVWLDAGTSANYNMAPGSVGYEVLLHEIGHALGLKHPGNYNAGTSAVDQPGNWLGTAEDSTTFTVMSYYYAPGGQSRDWYGMYDLQALKALYGANPGYNAGNNTYKYTDASGGVLGIIDDAGGTDSIDLSALTRGASVDMRPSGFSSVGWNGFMGAPAALNLSIDIHTTIENLVGSAYADNIIGNDAANRITPGAGADKVNGGGGIDTVVFGGTRGSYTVGASAGTITVVGGGATDTLTAVERLEFSNQKLAFDLAGNAGTVAKILGAVFGSSQLANVGYVGNGIGVADSGASGAALGQYALDAKLGLSASNQAVVDLLYANVIGHTPTAAESAYYRSLLDTGAESKGSLALMAANTDLNAQHIDLVGLTAHGIVYG